MYGGGRRNKIWWSRRAGNFVPYITMLRKWGQRWGHRSIIPIILRRFRRRKRWKRRMIRVPHVLVCRRCCSRKRTFKVYQENLCCLHYNTLCRLFGWIRQSYEVYLLMGNGSQVVALVCHMKVRLQVFQPFSHQHLRAGLMEVHQDLQFHT